MSNKHIEEVGIARSQGANRPYRSHGIRNVAYKLMSKGLSIGEICNELSIDQRTLLFVLGRKREGVPMQ